MQAWHKTTRNCDLNQANVYVCVCTFDLKIISVPFLFAAWAIFRQHVHVRDCFNLLGNKAKLFERIIIEERLINRVHSRNNTLENWHRTQFCYYVTANLLSWQAKICTHKIRVGRCYFKIYNFIIINEKIYHFWFFCCSFLVSASSHTWSFSWIAQSIARLNTNRETRPTILPDNY